MVDKITIYLIGVQYFERILHCETITCEIRRRNLDGAAYARGSKYVDSTVQIFVESAIISFSYAKRNAGISFEVCKAGD